MKEIKDYDEYLQIIGEQDRMNNYIHQLKDLTGKTKVLYGIIRQAF